MNGTAVVCGALLMLGSRVAAAQVPGPAPTEPAADAPPNPPAPPVTETPAPEAAPQPQPEPEQPRPRVRWSEPDAGSRSHEDLEREEGDPELESEQNDAPARPREDWSLQGSHFVLAVERITSVLAWSNVSTARGSGFGDPDVEVELSGTDAAFLGAGGAGRAISGVPRLAFDAVLDVGFTIGGSLSYVVSADAETTIKGTSTSESTTSFPDQSILLFATRMGALLRPSHNVGVWLRGGITRISTEETVTGVLPSGQLLSQEMTATLWHLSFDPQLVLVPAPRIAITVAGILDIGLPGTVESKINGDNTIIETEIKSSGYGVSAGLAAIF